MYTYIARYSMHEDHRAHFPKISKQKQKNSRSRTKSSNPRIYGRGLSKASLTVTFESPASQSPHRIKRAASKFLFFLRRLTCANERERLLKHHRD